MTTAAVAARAWEIFGIYGVSVSVLDSEGLALVSQRHKSRPIVQQCQEIMRPAVPPGTGAVQRFKLSIGGKTRACLYAFWPFARIASAMIATASAPLTSRCNVWKSAVPESACSSSSWNASRSNSIVPNCLR